MNSEIILDTGLVEIVENFAQASIPEVFLVLKRELGEHVVLDRGDISINYKKNYYILSDICIIYRPVIVFNDIILFEKIYKIRNTDIPNDLKGLIKSLFGEYYTFVSERKLKEYQENGMRYITYM